MMMITIIPGPTSTTTIKGMAGLMVKEKGMRDIKESRNSRYEESNVVNNKQKEYYLISTLSTASPLDTLGNWLIDSGASRHLHRIQGSPL